MFAPSRSPAAGANRAGYQGYPSPGTAPHGSGSSAAASAASAVLPGSPGDLLSSSRAASLGRRQWPAPPGWA